MVSLVVVSLVVSLVRPVPSPAIGMACPEPTPMTVPGDGTCVNGQAEETLDDVAVFRTVAETGSELTDAVVSPSPGTWAPVRAPRFRTTTATGATRLLFAPTARALGREDGEWGVFSGRVPFAEVGLTNRISIGFVAPFLFVGAPANAIWFTPKVQVVATSHTAAALGLRHPLQTGRNGAGLAYGVVTHGNSRAALTVGVSLPYQRGPSSTRTSPGLVVGGETRIARWLTLVTESSLASRGGSVSGAVRVHGDKVSLDFGLTARTGAVTRTVAPIVNVVKSF